MNATCPMLPEVDLCQSTTISRKPRQLKHLVRILVLLWTLPVVSVMARSQNAPATPINFGNNFFVTGDYLVSGAYGMTSNFKTINGVSYAVGTINVPDANSNGVANPGITGVTSVPVGGQIVAALLYWQTVEKTGLAAGAPGTGQNGYFLPTANAASFPQGFPGYAISGTNVNGSNTVGWSSGGCGGSGGKVIKTYRADVSGSLPVDNNGNTIANTSFQVLLPSTANASTPLTLGATLVVIYRLPGGVGQPNVPLNAIVIYDGDYAQTNAQQTMTQPMQGFYDANNNTVTRLTHIVGSGLSNKLQTVYLGKDAKNLTKLQSLYGNALPPFPGWYGSWDNPTWTFPSGTSPLPNDASGATTQVVPSSSNQGCVSWGAVILSTTVKNSDGDGILDSWKMPKANPPGYCDAGTNNGTCTVGDLTDPGWVPLPGATSGEKDVFLQYDYLCSKVLGAPAPGNSSPANTGDNSCSTTGGNYSFDPRLAVDPADSNKTAVEKVADAFENHKPFVLHAVVGNAILESDPNVTCTDSPQTGPVCPFPNEPGTVGFREGLADIKNLNINPNTGVLCIPGSQGCGTTSVFQHGKKDSYHYVLFSHGVGLPSWFLSDGSIQTMSQSGTTVTFVTSSAHGLAPIPGDTACPSSPRVTVTFGGSNPNLNGSYCATVVNPTTFTINVAANASVPSATYTSKTDPNLAVVNGQVTSMSGFSDVGGQNSVVSLGYGAWGPPNNPTSDGNTWQVKAGTFMHELGHTLGLTHGGTFYNNLVNNPNDFTPNFEANCKPNLQSVMNYQFQVDLLEPPGTQKQVVDYSEETLATLSESSPQSPPIFNNPFYDKTAWFELTSVVGGTPLPAHCDGTPLLGTDSPMSYVSDFVSNFGWSAATGEDINFNGSSTDVLHGHDEWDGTAAAGAIGGSPGVDLQQVSALGTISAVGLGGEAGVTRPGGGGGVTRPGGGGGVTRPGGGGGLKSDIRHEQANSYTRPPRGLTATEEASQRFIDLSWSAPTFGQIVRYDIKRSSDGGVTFTTIHSNLGTPPSTAYQDTVQCNPGGYQYKVTAFVINDVTQALQESVASNIVPTGDKLTGCYVVTGLSSPTIAKLGSSVAVTWTLTDDFYTTGNPVTRQAASTLVAVGPDPNNGCAPGGRTNLLLSGNPQLVNGTVAGTFANKGNQFTYTLNTGVLCVGSYNFELDLDSGQIQTTTPPLVLSHSGH